MSHSNTLRIYPLNEKGSAQDCSLISSDVVTLVDFSSTPRFGLKGKGTVAFLESLGMEIPEVNCASVDPIVLRLGPEEAVVLSDPQIGRPLSELKNAWNAAQAPKGYDAWREETWAWMHLSGPGVFDIMSKICPVDMRDGVFRPGQVAQTRVGYVDAITLRTDRFDTAGFDVFFDVSVTAFFVNAVTTAAAEFESADPIMAGA